MKRILTLLFILVLFKVQATEGYRIKVKIKQLANTKLELAYYFEDKQYIQDSVRTDKNGVAIFQGKKSLLGGLYMVIVQQKKYFDLLITDNQEFAVETDTTDLVKNMKISGDDENNWFYNYQKYVVAKNTQVNDLKEMSKKAKEKQDSINFQSKIKSIEDDLSAYWKKAMSNHPNTFFAHLINAMNGEPAEGYSRENFFNHIDFSDSKLLRTPVIHRAVRMVIARNLNKNKPIPVLIEEIDLLAQKAKANPDVYHYVLNYLLGFFNTYPRIGMNQVFVHIAETYYLKEKIDWIDEKGVKEIGERSEKLKSNFIGHVAPDFKMEMVNQEFMALHQVEKKYTLLLFWTVGCGHCEAAIATLQDFYKEVKGKSIEIVAVYTQNDKKAWEKFITDKKIEWINCYDPTNATGYRENFTVYSTPMMYLLNEKKEIVAMKIGPEEIKDLVTQLKTQKDKY